MVVLIVTGRKTIPVFVLFWIRHETVKILYLNYVLLNSFTGY